MTLTFHRHIETSDMLGSELGPGQWKRHKQGRDSAASNGATTYTNRERRHLWSSRSSIWLLISPVVDLLSTSNLAVGGIAMTPWRHGWWPARLLLPPSSSSS